MITTHRLTPKAAFPCKPEGPCRLPLDKTIGVLFVAILVPWFAQAQAPSVPVGDDLPSSSPCIPAANSLDLSGIVAFLVVTEELMSDREPTEQLWSELERTPGYAVLLENEFAESGFREPFRLAFQPSRRSDLETALEEGRYRYLNHYSEWVRGSWLQIPHLVRKLASGYDPCALSVVSAEYLPEMEVLEPPQISVVVFGPDARGYHPVVLDISMVESLPQEALDLLLAHEFHHFFRNQLKPQDRRGLEGADASIYWALDQLQAEGIADQLNIPFMLQWEFDDPPIQQWMKKYGELLDGAPESLQAFDQVVRSLAKGEPKQGDELEKAIREALPMACHPAGFHMARTTESVLGKDRLVHNVADPFAFFSDYQEAATILMERGNDTYVFSSETSQWILALEQRGKETVPERPE